MANALLVIGVHREELAFGRAVAALVDRSRLDVLEIPDGLPGRHPRADEHFQHGKLHRELYLQLLPHMRKHRMMIDLHSGLDEDGPCADIYSRLPERLADSMQNLLRVALGHVGQPALRLVRIGGDGEHDRFPSGKTSIPQEVWQAQDCLYVGLEIYLKKVGAGEAAEHRYARELIEALATAGETSTADAPRP